MVRWVDECGLSDRNEQPWSRATIVVPGPGARQHAHDYQSRLRWLGWWVDQPLFDAPPAGCRLREFWLSSDESAAVRRVLQPDYQHPGFFGLQRAREHRILPLHQP